MGEYGAALSCVVTQDSTRVPAARYTASVGWCAIVRPAARERADVGSARGWEGSRAIGC